MSDYALQVRGLSKRFETGKIGTEPFLKGFRRLAKNPRRLLNREFGTLSDKYFWALKDLNFEVLKGDGVGIIGHNGAGKSTLLKIISRILPPTEGEIRLYGTVNSLLEVGTGFQRDLTGRANIFLNASILGMSREETQSVFDEIVEFSGIRDFIDMPMKYYSTGMHSRLAFSIAANVTGDILVVDEVLAVGDAAFKKKCLSRMTELMGKDRTVLFVSHSMDAVLKFCTKGIWLDQGRIRAMGPVEDVAKDYMRSVSALTAVYGKAPVVADEDSEALASATETAVGAASDQPAEKDRSGGSGDGHRFFRADVRPQNRGEAAFVVSVSLVSDKDEIKEIFFRDEAINVAIDYEVTDPRQPIVPVMHLYCAPRQGVPDETHVFTSHGDPEHRPDRPGRYRSVVCIGPNLLITGQYHFSVALVTPGKPLIRHVKLDKVLSCQILDRTVEDSTFMSDRVHGVIRPLLKWKTTELV